MIRPTVVFAHGAGAPSGSDWMRAWRDRLSSFADVTAFDYPYMRAGRKTPDRLPALVAAHRQALADARAGAAARPEPGAPPVFLAGKSMGSRVGCHLAVELAAEGNAPIAGLVCFGYPLVAGSSGAVRDEVLLALTTPILFVQGSRDPLCPLDRLAPVRAKMRAPSELHVVEGANHSLELPGKKRLSEAQAEADRAVVEVVRRFIEKTPGERRG
jgi:uncharacterized protein